MICDTGAVIQTVVSEDDLRDSRFSEISSRPGDVTGETSSFKELLRPFLPPVILGLREKTILALGLADDNEHDGIPATADGLKSCLAALEQGHDQFSLLTSAIRRCDLVVIHGNGGMFGNGVMPRTKLFIAYAAKTLFDKPVILINHTADLSHPTLDSIASIVYPLLDDVTYRDRISASRCEGRWHGRYAADSAFLFEPLDRATFQAAASRAEYFSVWPDSAVFDPARPYICLGGSSAFSYDDTRSPLDLIEQFVTLATYLRSKYKGQIVLTVSDRIDEPVMRPVASKTGLPLIGLATPVQQAVDIVGNADAYIGGRWHVGIFALRGGTPVIPLSSKTFKMPALIEMAGLPDIVFDASAPASDAEAIGRRLAEALDEGEQLRRKLRSWASSQADNCRDNLRFLERLVE
jgi:polysaccharide pyruvyl transferase WcaK-like protein